MKLCQWSDLARDFKDGIILGNGASIAVDDHFSYKSLYKEATGSVSLDSGVTTIFESYKTHDFELVLGGLSTAHQVNVALGVHDVEVVGAYIRVRDALIKRYIRFTFHILRPNSICLQLPNSSSLLSACLASITICLFTGR